MKPNYQQYDKLFKILSGFMLPVVLKRSFGIDLKNTKLGYRELNTEFNTKLKQRHVDSLFLIYLDGKPTFILHLEFQMTDQLDMVYRMSEYHILIAQKYKDYEIYHAVIYAGRGAARMRTKLRENEIFRGFELLDLGRLDFDSLLNSNDPVEVMLALLTDYGNHSDVEVLKTIINRLEALVGRDDIFEYLSHLEVLSISRGLDRPLTNLIEAMYKVNFNADLRDHYLYKKGRQAGIELGKREGIELGKQEGIELARNEVVKETVISLDNNGVPLSTIAKYLNISLDRVKTILEK